MNLARIQLLSLATKAATTVLGIAQSIIVVRILSPAEFGLVGLVMSVGSVIGVTQHLGIVDGAIREIAIRKSRKEIARVAWVSHIVRQLVTLPLSAGLFFLAPFIASWYGHLEIAPYIQIFAGALIFQGMQDVLGATLTGMKRFVPLYVVQIITATINIAAFGILTWLYGVAGFFWAIILTTAIMVVLMGVVFSRDMKGVLRVPARDDIRKYGRAVLRIGAYMYLARIFFVVWQRLPLLVLGGVVAAEELGFLNISMTFGSKLTIVAMALSEVNLSWMSSLYVRKPQQFRAVANRNMQRVFLAMLGITLGLLFFTPEILRYIIGAEYLPAQSIIYIMTAAFFLYALLDIGTSSVFVAANNPRLRSLIFLVQLTVSAAVLGWLFLTQPNVLLASVGMLVSAAISYALMIGLARRYEVTLLPWRLVGLLGLFAAAVGWLFTEPHLGWRILLFVLVGLYMFWEAKRSSLLPSLVSIIRPGKQKVVAESGIICFAGAFYDAPNWTNRQHIMSRVSKTRKVLYVEPRVWLPRYKLQNIFRPWRILRYLWRIFWWERKNDDLYVISQWNLLPGSREYEWVSKFNHYLNRYCVQLKAWWLGFSQPVIWIYDTEAAEYLSVFPDSTVLYDCVDDHAAQAGVDRNADRVRAEEEEIFKRADIVTVTSRKLYELKKNKHDNVHLVLNAGDVKSYARAPVQLSDSLKKKVSAITLNGPTLVSVGALDSYKLDTDLLLATAKRNPSWQFVFVGQPIVKKGKQNIKRLMELPNTHFLGYQRREIVPAIVKAFDVCLIPYKYSRYNQSSFPLKFWEFMATGKPIVAAGVMELKYYSDMIGFARGQKDFTAAIKKALKDPKRGSRERIMLAKEHGWDHRVSALLSLLH